MANNSKVNNQEESNPLLDEHLEVNGTKSDNTAKADNTKTAKKPVAPEFGVPEYGWTANGMPLGHGSVMGEPMGRAHWDSSLCACLGRNDDFCSSDLEVCLLGSVAPCVLYGSNVERLGSVPGTFSNHCFPYTGLYLLGNSFVGWNCLAPLFSYPTRTAIRRKFNLEGGCEALNRSCGCCGSCVEDELQRELFESTCDMTTHICCHPCALCQEGREIRRRLPHPGFSAQPALVMIPPGEQSMGRGA